MELPPSAEGFLKVELKTFGKCLVHYLQPSDETDLFTTSPFYSWEKDMGRLEICPRVKRSKSFSPLSSDAPGVCGKLPVSSEN